MTRAERKTKRRRRIAVKAAHQVVGGVTLMAGCASNQQPEWKKQQGKIAPDASRIQRYTLVSMEGRLK